jgi:membrane protease YdiL (CAAX protease family)
MKDLSVIWMLIAISFFTYFLVSLVYKRLNVYNLEQALNTANGLKLLNLKHLVGIVLFGVLFYLLTPELNYLILVVEIPRLKLLLLILLTIFLCVYISNIASQKHKVQYHSGSHYNFSNVWLYIIIRLLFLFAYEFFFRGVLLYKFLEFNSLFIAIVYSTLLYVIIHLFDSKKEIIGAIPFEKL